MKHIGTIHLTPFEALHGFRPTYPCKDETYHYLKMLLSSPEFIGDAYAIMEYGLPFTDEISQRFRGKCAQYEEMVGSMSHELKNRFNNIHPETVYFILALQVHQELDSLNKLLSEQNLDNNIRQYNEQKSRLNFISDDETVSARQYLPLTLESNATQVGLSRLTKMLSSLVLKYKQVLNEVTEKRFDIDGGYSIHYGNVVFDISLPSAQRIHLDSKVMEVVKRYFMLLTMDESMTKTTRPMMTEQDVLELIAIHFNVPERVEPKLFKCRMKKTHLKFFIYNLYLNLKHKHDVTAEQLRGILFSFDNFQGENDRENVTATFTRPVPAFNNSALRIMTNVLNELK